MGPRWEGSGPDSGVGGGRVWGRDLRVRAGRSWGLDSGFQENGARVLGLREEGLGFGLMGPRGEETQALGPRREGLGSWV